MEPITSPTYPYCRDQQYNTMKGADEIPRKVCTYLMDMPLPGYNPPDSNDYPRARLMRYLYNDGNDPLNGPLPTPAQKMQILFDPLQPTNPPDPEKGYRIFPQEYVAQAQLDGSTRLYCSMGQSLAKGAYQTELSVVIDVITNVNYESAAGFAQSRTYAMECAILESMNGVNMDGVGTFYFDRTQHSGCGSWSISDRGTNLGRHIVLGLTWQG